MSVARILSTAKTTIFFGNDRTVAAWLSGTGKEHQCPSSGGPAWGDAGGMAHPGTGDTRFSHSRQQVRSHPTRHAAMDWLSWQAHVRHRPWTDKDFPVPTSMAIGKYSGQTPLPVGTATGLCLEARPGADS